MDSSQSYSSYINDTAQLETALVRITLREEPFAEILTRLRQSKHPDIESLAHLFDYPEVICTRSLEGPIKDWKVQTLRVQGRRKSALVKPLTDLIKLMGKIQANGIERDDLTLLKTHYEEFLRSIRITTGEGRLRLLKGPARLYGLHKVWQVEQSRACKMASVNEYNESQQTNAYGASAVSQIDRAHIKRVRINPLRPGMEVTVDLFGKRLFRQGTAAYPAAKTGEYLGL